MTNEQIISKMKEDMKMRGFSHWTEESYLLKTKDIIKYFRVLFQNELVKYLIAGVLTTLVYFIVRISLFYLLAVLFRMIPK